MKQITATGSAAMAGDATATARMMAFRQAAATALGKPVDEMPTLADIAAAQRGDKVALQHLREFNRTTSRKQQAHSDSQESSDSSANFAGFFPSLKRRLKRLDRMGAHVELESDSGKTWIVIAVLSILLGPFALLAVALLLLLIGIMMLSSLTFLAIWMAFIHQLFVIFLHH